MNNEQNKDKDLELSQAEDKVVDFSKKEKKEKPKAEKKAPKAEKKEKVSKVKKEDKSKKLTLDVLNKENNKLDVRVVGKIEVNGSEYEVEYDQIFRASKQQKVLDEILGFYEKVDELGTGILDIATPYFVMLIIKNFTSIEVPDDIEEAMNTMSVLIDLDILHKILNMLPEKEVEKVNKLIEEALAVFQENLARAEEEIKEKIESGEIKNAKELGLEDEGEEIDLTEYSLEDDSDKPVN